MRRAQRGHFITFEGGEGSGKTSLIDRIAQELAAQQVDVLVTREPGGTLLGEQVRQLVLHRLELSVCPAAELCLFLASRAQHLHEIILPNLQAGKMVLCDRFNDSSVAYQGEGRGLSFDRVKEICRLITQEAQPEMTFILDLDPEKGWERLQERPLGDRPGVRVDRIEKEELSFHRRVRQAYLAIGEAEPDRCVVLDASLPQEVVFQSAWARLKKCAIIT